MSRFSYYILRIVAESFRLVPFSVLYRISDGLAWLLRNVIGYRKTVIRNNLERAFPEKTPAELDLWVRETYRNLTDITLETIKGFTYPLEKLLQRCHYANLDLAHKYIDQGQSVFIAGAHFNCWEWPCFTVPLIIHGKPVCVYKKLSNSFVDQYYKKCRERGGMTMVEMEDTYAAMRKFQHEPSSYYLVSDQSPSSIKNAHWVTFFGRETAFLPGLDFLSRRFRYPVIYYQIDRVKRGFYRITFFDIYPEPSGAKEGDITAKYVEYLEKTIREAPASWLWSHKRWKHQRQSA